MFNRSLPSTSIPLYSCCDSIENSSPVGGLIAKASAFDAKQAIKSCEKILEKFPAIAWWSIVWREDFVARLKGMAKLKSYKLHQSYVKTHNKNLFQKRSSFFKDKSYTSCIDSFKLYYEVSVQKSNQIPTNLKFWICNLKLELKIYPDVFWYVFLTLNTISDQEVIERRNRSTGKRVFFIS